MTFAECCQPNRLCDTKLFTECEHVFKNTMLSKYLDNMLTRFLQKAVQFAVCGQINLTTNCKWKRHFHLQFDNQVQMASDH